MGTDDLSFDELAGGDPATFAVRTRAPGPAGRLPLEPDDLLKRPSGDVFAWSQNVGMGWSPRELRGREFLILSTQGGVRAEDGTPVALGYHVGHWEVGLLVREAARALRERGAIPFAAFCSDPCDGRTQGTAAMMDSLAWRNDAASLLGRMIRSLPNRSGVLGVATCDKGLPAMLMALAGSGSLATILVPGGVTLPAEEGEDAGKVQSIGVRYAHREIDLETAARLGCRACASPGGGCQFLGTAATSQVVAEALGMTLPHAALAPSGQAIWRDLARRSAVALTRLVERGITTRDIVTAAAVRNAMAVHAAVGGSTNLLLHLPAIAHAAGVARPGAREWTEVNRAVPRLVDVLPNGPVGHPTVRFFLAGGVPEVELWLREAGLLDLEALTASGEPLGRVLEWWRGSERRARLRERLRAEDGVDPDQVVFDPARARRAGLASTVVFPGGNLAPEGSVVKSTAIDPALLDSDGVYRKTGPARVFLRERDAIAALKSRGADRVRPGDVMVLACRGPLGAGMEEIFQITAALRYLSFGGEIAVITDARFSGVSTGPCVGHVSPEALAGGPIGKLRDGDSVRIVIDRERLEGSLDLVGEGGVARDVETGRRILESRRPREDLRPDPDLPDATLRWALLQAVCGGIWGGCVHDAGAIAEALGGGGVSGQ